MPQGVEHVAMGQSFRVRPGVRIPLMPQGVEHMAIAALLGVSLE